MDDRARAEAADPATGQGRLAEIAGAHPELRSAVFAHPNAYPALRDWIAAQPVAVPKPQRRVSAPVVLIASGVALLLGLGGLGTAAALTGGFGLIAPSHAPTNAQSTPAASSNPAPSSTAPSNTGAPSNTASATVPTVLILDASGSMVRDVPGGGSRMDAARAAITELVDGLGSTAQLGLTVFGTTTGSDDSERAAGCSDVTVAVPVGAVDKARFDSAISGVTESGFTPLGAAMRTAASQLPQDAPATIVLVSDGVDTCSPPPSCDVASELRSANPQLTIHAIGFLVDADEEAQEQLKCIAEVGDGEYFSAANAAQLGAKLRIASDPDSVSGTVTTAGFEKLRLGMSLEAARSSVDVFTEGTTTATVIYVDCGFATLEFTDKVLTSIAPKKKTSTAEGLAIGDPTSRATELYGASTDSGSDARGNWIVYPASSDGSTGYRVYTKSKNTISFIVVCLCGPNKAVQSTVADWEIGFDGIGPAKFGMPFTDVYALLPEPDGGWIDPEECPAVQLGSRGAPSAITMFGAWSDAPDAPAIHTARVFMINNYNVNNNALPKTARGVGMGSTLADLERAYPGITIVEGGRYTIGTYAVITGRNGNSIVFGFGTEGSDTVNYLQVGNLTAPPYEFCG